MLFLIPKNTPPTLDASYSKLLREFVALCLQRDPLQRPTAKELLKHRFIKQAKKTSYLVDLIDRADRWKLEGGEKDQPPHGNSADEDDDSAPIVEDLWDFGTVRVQPRAGGTIRGHHNQNINPPLGAPAAAPGTGIRAHDYGAQIGKTAASAAETVRQNVLGVANAVARPAVNDVHAYSPPPPAAVSSDHSAPPGQAAPQWEDEEGGGHSRQQTSESQAEGETIMHTVVLPVIDSIHDRITNPHARQSILALRRAIEQAERDVPGLMDVLISEIVDSVEPEPLSEDDDQARRR